ncbi:MAG: ATP synthase F1 subunit delta [Roseburia sp.]|nr:ATP synthase F1 subunit delta [Roseburia sp.]
MAKLVSKTYGDALFEVALEKNQLDEFLDEVKAAQTAIEENKELFKLMSHPKIVKEETIKIITDIFTGKVSEELVGLLRMIVDKGHFEQVDSVFTYFIDEVKEYKNIGTAYVTSAMELSGAQKAAVEKRLLETTKYVKFEMHYDVDAELIGGMVIRIGDRVVDSSVRTKLYDLTRELSKIQLKAGECAS